MYRYTHIHIIYTYVFQQNPGNTYTIYTSIHLYIYTSIHPYMIHLYIHTSIHLYNSVQYTVRTPHVITEMMESKRTRVMMNNNTNISSPKKDHKNGFFKARKISEKIEEKLKNGEVTTSFEFFPAKTAKGNLRDIYIFLTWRFFFL
jgi:hypothetical protein